MDFVDWVGLWQSPRSEHPQMRSGPVPHLTLCVLHSVNFCQPNCLSSDFATALVTCLNSFRPDQSDVPELIIIPNKISLLRVRQETNGGEGYLIVTGPQQLDRHGPAHR